MNWKKIDSAPKDKTIDLWVQEFRLGAAGKVYPGRSYRVADAMWGQEFHIYLGTSLSPSEHRYGGYGWVKYTSPGWELIEDDEVKATHWMPLPGAPGTKRTRNHPLAKHNQQLAEVI